MAKLHILPPLHMEQKEKNFVCAFTGKAVRFAEMMTKEGWECIFYHNGDTDVTCCETVQLLTGDEYWKERRKIEPDDAAYLSPSLMNWDSQLVQSALNILFAKVESKYQPEDIFCHVFGATYKQLQEKFPQSINIETGIGYNFSWAPYRIYETYAWMSYINGTQNTQSPSNYDFVIPNYYRPDDWKMAEHEKYVLWGNRVVPDKGLWILRDIAQRMSHIPFVVAGAGDLPAEIRSLPNVFYVGTLSLEKRKEVWSKAMCTLMPSTYFEPFGGFHVEGMLCGVPAITSDFGCFSETVVGGVNGYRCKTLGDWIKAVDMSKDLNKSTIQQMALSKYSMDVVGKQYTAAFNQIIGLKTKGWYDTEHSYYLDTQLPKNPSILEEIP